MRFTTAIRALGLAVLLAACDPDAPPSPPTEEAEATQSWRYERGLSFAAWNDDGLTAAPFAFRVRPRGDRYEREVRAWLARDEAWDPYVEESWSAPAVGGVWKVVPHGELRLAAARSGVEALWYDSGGRRLRLDFGSPRSPWHGGERERFRLLDGSLSVGSDPSPGVILEELQITRPASPGGPAILYDRLLLLDREGFALYLLHERPAGAADSGDETAWTLARGAAEASREGQVEWVEVRPLQEARRDIPLHWRFEAPESGVHGEITATGYQTSVGLERGGRRDVEVRYTVEGWLERDGERVEVMGLVRHEQR